MSKTIRLSKMLTLRVMQAGNNEVVSDNASGLELTFSLRTGLDYI